MPVLSLCVKQYPRVLQGFKLQADALTGHLPRPGSQPVDEAALAIETQHVRIFKKTHTHKIITLDSDACNCYNSLHSLNI